MTETLSPEGIAYMQYVHDLNVEFYSMLIIMALVAVGVIFVVYKLWKFLYEL